MSMVTSHRGAELMGQNISRQGQLSEQPIVKGFAQRCFRARFLLSTPFVSAVVLQYSQWVKRVPSVCGAMWNISVSRMLFI